MAPVSSTTPGGVEPAVLDAAAACALRYSIRRMTVEDIDREAGVSRATIYRVFRGGRDEIITRAVQREVDGFFAELAGRLEGISDPVELLARGLEEAHAMLAEHALWQKVAETEMDLVVSRLTVEAGRVVEYVADFLSRHLDEEVCGGPVTGDGSWGQTCGYLARMFLSYLEAPGGWDMTDPAEVRELVATQMLGRPPRGPT